MRKCFAILVFLLSSWSLLAQLTILIQQLPSNTPTKDTLFLAGNMNNWAPNHLDFQFQWKNDKAFLNLKNIRTDSLEFKITRGNWASVETDYYGQFISNRQYATSNDTISISVLNWDDLPVNSPKGWARLIIEKLPDNTPPETSIYAVGSFNAWRPSDPAYKLSPQEDGTLAISIPLMSDTTYYKFSRGSWKTIEGRANGRARVNRILVQGEEETQSIRVAIESWEDLSGRPINIYTFLLLLAAFQGLLLILAINTLQDNNRAANRILSGLLLVLSIALAARVATYDREIFNYWPKLLLLPDFIYFLYAPLFLVYINKLLRQPAQDGSAFTWWHFLLFLLHLLAYFPLMAMDKGTFITAVVDQDLKPTFAWTGGLALLFNIVFWVICRNRIQQYESEYGDSHAIEPNLEFLRVVMWLKFACLIIWVSTYAIGGFGWGLKQDFSFITDKSTDILWITFSLTTFFLGYYTMRQPEIFKLPAKEDIPSAQGQQEQEQAASMDDRELAQIKKKLESIMLKEQPYSNPGLSLKELAQMVETSLHSLSRVINEGYQMNFNDFVNSYRVEEFKKLVKEDKYKNHTLLAIAFIVGFNSKSAFNRSFKKLENCTPREYLNTTTNQ